MQILTYTDMGPPHHIVCACKYKVEIHAYTAAVTAMYCSEEGIHVHIRTYTAKYVSYTAIQYMIRTPTYINSIRMYK